MLKAHAVHNGVLQCLKAGESCSGLTLTACELLKASGPRKAQEVLTV